jgi:amino acid adenylation domain-containing protein
VEFEIEYKNSSTDYTDYPDEEIHHSSFIIHHFIRAFDLSKAPLLRVGLVKIAEARYIFLVDIHHIISDGTSIQVLVQDFLALYAGKELPEIKLQYKDYAEWQNRERGSKMIQEQSEYWKKEFEGEIPVLELPLDYARPAVQGFEGNTIDFEFSNETTGALKSLALETGSTLYIVLLSLYNILLSRLSNQEDIVIGSPVAARRHADLEKIIGMFVNTLALRYFPVEEKKYVDFLEEVKEKTLKGLENQEYQYEDLVENVAVARDVSRNPLFDTMFTLQNTGTQKLEIPNLKLTPYKFENQTAKFDLELTGVEIKDKLLFELEYSTKLFKRETVERFILYFKNLANGISENKERKICDLEIFAEEEKRRILFEFNDTEAEYPEDKIISQLFEAQVSKTPDHVAVVGAGSQTCPIALSYNKLNEQSDRLAGLLNEKGVLADSIVGIMMERSVEMIIGIMGIFKAGGAYLPIDPDYPQERIDYMLNDSRAKILLAMEESRKKIIINCQLLIVNYELLSSAPQAPFHHSSFIIYHSKQLAYIIYTSGTTGKPKGAMIEHRGMVNHIYAKIHDLQLDNRSVVAQNASQMFDISVWQFFAALIIGGRTVIIPNEIIREPMNFMAHILDSKITILEVVPSYLAALLDIPSGENSYSSLPLQYLLVTGEAVNPGLLKKWFSKYPGIKVVNAYGPTEASDDITHHIMDKAPEMNQVPIGSPVQNMKIYIVDKYMVLCPLGVPGELYVAGAGIGRGYLNRPQLTAEKFFKPRSHRSYKTHILYKTGDLARWLNDGPPAGGTTKGIIEFLGRIDHQVKIRGFRIELGEIETQLVKHVDIKEAVVIAREEETGNKYLCAYVVSNKEFKIADLREHLVKELPDYMVPAYFVAMEKIPLTPNGKVDRKALPIPGINAGEEYIGPRDEAEKGVLYIVADILGINPAKISVRANFFNLGLNSITILKIAHRISDEFKINFPIGTLFTSPSVEGVAADMKKGYYPGASRRAVLLNRGKADKNLFLISGDGAIYIFKELALLLEDRFNVYGIQGKGIMDTGKLPETRQELYEDFIEEIKLVQPEGPYLVGGHCFGAIIAYEVTRILEERKNKITKLVMLDHHAVTRDYVFNFIIFFRCFNKCRNALLALKKAAKSAQAKLSREGHSDMQNENDNNRGVIPEDLEARRLEVERNYRYIINQLWIYSRIVKAPVLVLKSDESVHDPDPRWDPNTIAKMSKTSVKQVRTPGEHYSMFENPHLPVLAKLLLELI